MANEVTNYISVVSENSELHKKLEEIFGVSDNTSSKDLTEVNFINWVFDLSDDFDFDRSWMEDNIGAKWVKGEHVNQFDNTTELVFYSAWYQADKFCEAICNKLQEIDENVIVKNNFEEESYDFVGSSFFSKIYSDEELVDMDDWDVDRLWDDDDYRNELFEYQKQLSSTFMDYYQDTLKNLEEE